MKRWLSFLLLCACFGAPGAARAQTPVAPTISAADASIIEGNGGFRELLFPVTLSSAQSFDVSASFVTKAITAQPNSDFTPQLAGQVVFKAGQTRVNILIRVVGDTVEERDETFLVQLGAPKRCAISDSDGIGSIKDDDYGGQISVSDVSVSEGNSGQKIAKPLVSLSRAPLHDIFVNYETKDDSAKATTGDYISARGALLFKPGRLILTAPVLVVGDTNVENDEKCLVRISAPGLPVTKSLGVVSIGNDDTAPTPTPVPTVTPTPEPVEVSIGDVAVSEGNGGEAVQANFTVSLAAPATRELEISYSTQNDSALAPGDYGAATGVVRVPFGATSASFGVAIVSDRVEESDESFAVRLSSPGGLSGDAKALCLIRDDDYAGQISISDVSRVEGDSGQQSVPLVISLSSPCLHALEIACATEDGTARAGSDYAAATGTTTIAAGYGVGFFSVALLGDSEVESDENLAVQLVAPGYTFAKSRAALTIVNDDSPPANISGKIAYQSNGDVWVMNGDGTQQTRLTANASFDYSPGLSADGKRITFISDRSGSRAVWIMNADGSGQKLLFQQTGSFSFYLSPRFSPDGSKIVVSVAKNVGDYVGSLLLINADGTGPVELSKNAYQDTQIAYSPDGKRIAFTSKTPTDANPRISVVGVDGTGETALTAGSFFDFDPAFSPDGSKIAWVSNRGGNHGQIYVMNADGSGETALASGGFTSLFTPCFSPDGKKIAFAVFLPSFIYRLAVMNADGSDQKLLTTTDAYSTSWSIGTVAAPPGAASAPRGAVGGLSAPPHSSAHRS